MISERSLSSHVCTSFRRTQAQTPHSSLDSALASLDSTSGVRRQAGLRLTSEGTQSSREDECRGLGPEKERDGERETLTDDRILPMTCDPHTSHDSRHMTTPVDVCSKCIVAALSACCPVGRARDRIADVTAAAAAAAVWRMCGCGSTLCGCGLSDSVSLTLSPPALLGVSELRSQKNEDVSLVSVLGLAGCGSVWVLRWVRVSSVEQHISIDQVASEYGICNLRLGRRKGKM